VDARKWGLRDTQELFQQACRTIGLELIKRGHSLILGSASLHTADGNALEGAREAWAMAAGIQKDRPRVMMIRPANTSSNHRNSYATLHQSMPGGIVEYPVDAASWSSVKLVQTHFADALILVGGAEKTEQAGLAATISKKPLACIGSFGGAACKLNKVLSPNPWDYEDDRPNDLLQLQVPFDDRVLSLAFERAGIEGAPKLMVIHGRSTDRDVLKEYLLRYVKRVIVLTDEFDPTQPIPIKFERAASSVDGAIALVTPDDVGRLADDSASPTQRARENVWVEVGWFWGRRGRSKLLLLTKGNVNIPSDLGNVEHYPYVKSPDEPNEAIQKFLDRLRSASDR
jgi:hypothetical protein